MCGHNREMFLISIIIFIEINREYEQTNLAKLAIADLKYYSR